VSQILTEQGFSNQKNQNYTTLELRLESSYQMNEIKFKHNYIKLQSQTSATLIKVRILNETNEMLRIYDTLYNDNGITGDHVLPDCPCIQLIFLGDIGIPFCTLRNIKDYDYYMYHTGEKFDIVIEASKRQ
jgi:hypothetical protein